MSASQFKSKAERGGNYTGSMNRGRCCCHPPAYGLKKGLRRARRRVGAELIRAELIESVRPNQDPVIEVVCDCYEDGGLGPTCEIHRSWEEYDDDEQ